MSLKAKIFLAFFIIILCLLGSILYIIDTQTQRHEIARISHELELAQLRFKGRLEEQQKNTQRLVETITLDQKFRSFLTKIKDNFYSFTEEIALQSDMDIVFMVDDLSEPRGIYPATENSQAWLEKHLSSFRLKEVFENGKPFTQVISLSQELFSAIYIPLKESLTDDYAVGVIVVCKKIDNDWVKWLLGPKMKSLNFQVMFFSGNTPVAGNVSSEKSSAILQKRAKIEDGTGSFILSQEHYIARQAIFEEAGENAGYILSSNLDLALKPFNALQKKIIIMGLIITSIGLAFSLIFSNRIVQPLISLVSGTEEVVRGNYDFRIQYHSRDEVGQLSEAFNHMMEGLREKELIRNTFDKYVNPSIVDEVLANPEKLKLGGHRQVQTILFSDIAGFTSFSEKMAPDDLILLLNEYLGAMTEELTKLQGILDKYLGDGIMAFWGPPFCKGNHAFLACQTALDMQKKLAVLRPKWIKEGKPEIRIRIGLATGEMIVGNIGSENAQDYTCIGDTVNFSSRLESLNKFYGTEILIDADTYRRTHELVVRELDTVKVKGREQGAPVYELVGLESEVNPDQKRLIHDYEKALFIYRDGNFESAGKMFARIFEEFPHDAASEVMYKRCQNYVESPPAEWVGVHTMKEK